MADNATNLRAVFGEMEKRFKKGSVPQETAFYFSFGDGPGEKWTLRLGPEKCEVKEGKHVENADCVLKTSPDLFLKMVRGEWTPGAMDFMRGKIKANDIEGLKLLKDCFT